MQPTWTLTTRYRLYQRFLRSIVNRSLLGKIGSLKLYLGLHFNDFMHCDVLRDFRELPLQKRKLRKHSSTQNLIFRAGGFA